MIGFTLRKRPSFVKTEGGRRVDPIGCGSAHRAAGGKPSGRSNRIGRYAGVRGNDGQCDPGMLKIHSAKITFTGMEVVWYPYPSFVL